MNNPTITSIYAQLETIPLVGGPLDGGTAGMQGRMWAARREIVIRWSPLIAGDSSVCHVWAYGYKRSRYLIDDSRRVAFWVR